MGSKIPNNKAIDNYRINHQITTPELRVIDETGKNLGVLPLKEAKEAAATRGLDLILINPATSPPIAKIFSYDKFRYQKEKEFKKQRLSQKAPELKQIQISPKEAKNDLLIKIKKIEKFLTEGHKVAIVVVLRGREKGMQDFAKAKLTEFLAMIATPYKITQEVKPGGRGLIMQIEKQ